MNLRKKLNQELADLRAANEAIFKAAETGGTDAQAREMTAEEQATIKANLERKSAIEGQLALLDADRDAGWPGEQARSNAANITVRDRREDQPWAETSTGQKHPAPFGLFLQAVHRAAVGQGVDPRLLAAAQGMGEAIPSDGGYAVPMEFAAGIEKEMWETGQILSRVQDRPISGNAITFNYIDETSRADGSRRGSVLGYWIDEGTAPTASRPKLNQSEMKLRKIGALGYQTDELLQDAPALEAEMREDFLEELTFMTEDAIINGNGVGKPLGIVGHAAVVSVTKETSQAAATIEFNNVNKMWSRVFAHRRRNLVWLINQDCEEQLNQMTLVIGTGGVPVYLPAGGLSVDGFGSLFGRSVIPVEYCAALGTVGDIILVDLSRYRVIRKASGPEFASSMHVAFTTGEMAFRAFYRVDGQPIPRTTIAPKAGNAKSTIAATLATRA